MLRSANSPRNTRAAIGITVALTFAAAFGIDAVRAQSPFDRDGLEALIDGRVKPTKPSTERTKPTAGGPARVETAPMKVGAPDAAPTTPGEPLTGSGMQKLTGVWVQGPGFDITYGVTYERCAERCLTHKACVMVEYYRPEKKCNLYNAMRPRLKGGSSIVGIRG